MKKKPLKWFARMLAVSGALLLAAGCASTPGDRIKKDQALFDSFPPEVQSRIRNGEIDIGFTEAMVLMAKDMPDRKYTRKTEAGEIIVWSYIGIRVKPDRQRVQVHGSFPVAGGTWRSYDDWIWVDVQREQEYELFRVEFTNGKVSAFETLAR